MNTIREVEKNILDAEYKNYKILMRNYDSAIGDEFLFDLSKETMFGDYDLQNFIDVYSASFINFIYYTWYEDYIDLNYGLENHLGSCSLSLKREDFIDWLSNISFVEKRKG